MSHVSQAEADAPLMFGQERHYRTGNTVPQYLTFRIDGLLDVPAFAAAVDALVRKHDALTLGFRQSDDKRALMAQRSQPVAADDLWRLHAECAAGREPVSELASGFLSPIGAIARDRPTSFLTANVDGEDRWSFASSGH